MLLKVKDLSVSLCEWRLLMLGIWLLGSGQEKTCWTNPWICHAVPSSISKIYSDFFQIHKLIGIFLHGYCLPNDLITFGWTEILITNFSPSCFLHFKKVFCCCSSWPEKDEKMAVEKANVQKPQKLYLVIGTLKPYTQLFLSFCPDIVFIHTTFFLFMSSRNSPPNPPPVFPQVKNLSYWITLPELLP